MRNVLINFYENNGIIEYGEEYLHWVIILDENVLDEKKIDRDNNKIDKTLPLCDFLNIATTRHLKEYYLREDFQCNFNFLKAIDDVLNGKLDRETYGDEEICVEINKEITSIERNFNFLPLSPPFSKIGPNDKYGVRYLEKEEMYNEINTQELRELLAYCINEIEKYAKEYDSKGITLYF